MKIKLHVITLICISAGRVRRVGDMEHQIHEVKGKTKPEASMTKKKDEFFGLWREVMRTELKIDAPELDGKELTELQIQSLVAERSDLEANFYVAKKRIDERIASLQAIEHTA